MMKAEEVPQKIDQPTSAEVTSAEVKTSPVTQKINALLSSEGRIETLEDLDFVVEHHSALLSGNKIIGIVHSIPPALEQTPQARFLQTVLFYHKQHHRKVKKWGVASGRFAKLPAPEKGTLLGFYQPNYSFLSLRNAGGGQEELQKLYEQAMESADAMPEPVRSQLRGFALFNYSRLLLKFQENEKALEHYIEAAKARMSYYEEMKTVYFSTHDYHDHVTLCGAATQVWKMREDWGTFLPDMNIDMCPVTKELYDETKKIADTNFSVKK